MGCNSSAPRDGDRDPGLCVIEVIRLEHLPNMDVTSLTDAYVKVRFTDKIDQNIHDSIKLKTNVQWNSLNPVYHSFLAFPFFPNEPDTVALKIVDQDVTSQNDDIGDAEIMFHQLLSKIGEEVTLDVKLKKGLKSVDGEKTTVTIRLVKLERETTPKKIRKEFFVIRHGESLWNESQKDKQIKGMVSQYDHELTALGIEQAQEFNRRWKEVKDHHLKDQHEDLKAFLSASVIFSSPLTRASQTALLTCQDHPVLHSGGLILLRNLREIKNFGSFDTVGSFVGEEIEANVKSKLSRDMGREAADFDKIKFDAFDAEDSWWTPLQEKENKDMVDLRFKLLWTMLRFGTTANTAILVGHSHFFRHMVREHMSPQYREKEPEWTKVLDKAKLGNGSCLRLVVEWDTTKGPMEHPVIHSARLVFGSTLANVDVHHESVDKSNPFSHPSLLNDVNDNKEDVNTRKSSNSISNVQYVAEATEMESF